MESGDDQDKVAGSCTGDNTKETVAAEVTAEITAGKEHLGSFSTFSDDRTLVIDSERKGSCKSDIEMEIDDKCSGEQEKEPEDIETNNQCLQSMQLPDNTKEMIVATNVSISKDKVSASDYACINSVVDKLYAQFIVANDQARQYQSCILSMYVQALRAHFMSREFFATRSSYVDVSGTDMYKRHKEFFFSFDEGDMHIDTVAKCPVFDGTRTITSVMEFMFPRSEGYSWTTVPRFSLPRITLVEKSLKPLNDAFSEFIRGKMIHQQSLSSPASARNEVDLTIVFVDFTAYDLQKGKPLVTDFPNRISSRQLVSGLLLK
jgi:hypothetical protein